ncbi:ABC transporter ATP-binding protein [Streptomyces rimosus]|uniref:ABC transporter ATP-binding protein n=1 Tax=Streptomyces rimosus TaxID=1927 RepID=UPI0004C99546|nr:ABC transporter ATP-binding protein [Streptomyces rimosus]
MKSRRVRPRAGLPVSESERVLFGGALRYDLSYTRHEMPLLRMGLWAMARQFPAMMGTVARAAWREDRSALLALLGAEAGQGVLRAFTLVATNQVLVALFAAGPTPARLRQALPALAAVAIVAVFSSLLSAVSTAASGQLEPKIERVCTARFYQGVIRVELAALEDQKVHRALDAGRFGTDSIRMMLGSSILVLNALIGLIAAAGVLFLLHPLLVLMLFLVAAPKGWSAVLSARRQYDSRHTWIEHRRAISVITQKLTDQACAAEIRVHGAGRLLVDAYADMSRTMEREQQRLARAEAATQTVASAGSGLAALGAYGVLWLLLVGGGMPLAVAGTAVIAVRTSSAGLLALVMQFNRLYEEAMYLKDWEDACTLAERHAIPEGGEALSGPLEEVRLEKVSFTYPGAASAALDKVDLTIPRGTVVALVGANGSGKSTLAKLVAGLYLPGDGRLLWNGTDTRDADREAVFGQVALLAQDFPHWPMTARANVHIGRSDQRLDQWRVERAADGADATDMITALPHGWDSLVVKGFERGTQLSGGQWQRLGGARARYREAALLVVDEPTSALDPRAEIETFRALRALTGGGTTVLLITHRLAATASADLIYVLDAGRLIEQGTHTELMALAGGHYRSLYEIQAAQYATVVPDGSGRRDSADGEGHPKTAD